MFITHALAVVLAALPVSEALSQLDLRQRSIYQVLTDRFERGDGQNTYCDPSRREYCGGTWKGITSRLDYIQEMGFDTVWISPVVANIEGQTFDGYAYHGYWMSDLTKLNAHFGTPRDLLDLSNALHARGMYLMVDVVVNHVGAFGATEFKPGPLYGPFDSPADYHPYKLITDWEDRLQSEQGWLTDRMPDLNTENPHVVNTMYRWVQDLVKTYKVDALRIDTVKHIRKDFWPGFVQAAGVAVVGEVLHGDPVVLASYQKSSMPGLLDYASYYTIRRAFESTSPTMHGFVQDTLRLQKTMSDPTQLGSFLDSGVERSLTRRNHDYPRFAGVATDPVLARNAAVYPFINDGFPVIYSGQEQGLTGGDDPYNREATWNHGFSTSSPNFLFFKKLNFARRKAITSYPAYFKALSKVYLLNTHCVAISKAPFFTILSNVGSRSPPVVLHVTSDKTGYKASMPVIDILSGHVYATDPKGALSVAIIAGEPRVFLPLAVYRSQGIVPKESWLAGLKVDTDIAASNGAGSKSPLSGHRKTNSIGRGRMFGLFGSKK